ncbi:MAG TPA: hypothetical protein VM617_00225 [Thermoanaerobaculia bacterium]|nr:hypothetical protein [Thermoanaerobaculia bacterium]
MTKRDLPDSAAPTMIIPRGTEIEVDPHGQLSVRAPGHLVIQNSGSYGTIESRTGSIRIDHGVEVEAVSVRCAQDCFVLGSLTAWKVTARTLQLEETARANIVLQETERLDVGRGARLVGNFDSEKELFVLFSRFAREFRSLPFFLDRREGPTEEERHDLPPVRRALSGENGGDQGRRGGEPERRAAGGGRQEEASPVVVDLPEPLFFALVLLDRDAARGDYGHSSQRALSELINLLQEGDLETLHSTSRTLLGRIVEPRQDVRRAAELVDGWFAGEGRAATRR